MSKAMRGLSRSPLEQAAHNLEQAVRAAQMIKEQPCELLPSPLTLLLAELTNVRRYLQIAQQQDDACPQGQ